MTKTLSLARDHENQREVVRTPRSNRQLPQLLAPFATLAEGLDYAAQGVTGFNFYSARGALQDVLPYALLRRRALSTARKLLSLGLKRGDRVAVVAETGPDFMVVFFACQYAGLVPCPMPYTMYIGGKDAYVERVAGMLRAARAGTVITPEDLLGHISEGADARRREARPDHSAICNPCRKQPPSLSHSGPDEQAYIQYSSGSTSSPKGVLISQNGHCRQYPRHSARRPAHHPG